MTGDVTEPRPLLVDTGAFFAYYYERATEHDVTRDVFARIRDGDLRYRPLFTSQAVLAELATLLCRKATHADAVRAVGDVWESESFDVLPIDSGRFETSLREFERYDDQVISFVDHTTGALADELDVEHVFAFDEHFQTLGLTRVPVDTGAEP